MSTVASSGAAHVGGLLSAIDSLATFCFGHGLSSPRAAARVLAELGR